MVDEYAARMAYLGATHCAVVAGAISPKLSGPSLFFAGNPVRAYRHSERLSLDGNTPFEIGSITKVFNSWLFAYRGKDYAGTVGDYAKLDLPDGIANLRIENIANYSSGFPTDNKPPIWWERLAANDRPLSPRDLVSGLRGKQLPQCAPGQFYSYSNFAWGLMGLATIGIEGEDRDSFAQWEAAVKELCLHIGLSENTVPASPATALVIPAGYSGSNLVSARYSYVRSSWTTLGGGGDLVSTGNDMMAWLTYNMGIGGRDYSLLKLQQAPRSTWSQQEPPQPALSSSSNQSSCPTPLQMAKPAVTALGWFVNKALHGDILVKNGGVAGFGSWMGFKPWVETDAPSEVGAFVLTNSGPTGNGSAADLLGNAIMRTIWS